MYLLLIIMSMSFRLSRKYRKHIEEFRGKYIFRSKDGLINVSVIFKKGRISKQDIMKVTRSGIEGANVTIIFRDASVVKYYILSKKPDILNSILNQDISIQGNLTYMYKFGYMASQLQKMLKA